MEVISDHRDARVLKAVHKQLGTTRLLKGIRRSSPEYSRLLAEAYLLKNLHCRGIPEIIDLEEEDNCTFIVEQYIEGCNLAEYCRRRFLSRRELYGFLLRICDILIYLHSQDSGILYMDLKPENIMIDESRELWLVDYGSSRKSGDAGLMASYGTRAYAAPEQRFSERADKRTDIYGLGALMEVLLNCSELSISEKQKLGRLSEACRSSAPWRRPSTVEKVRNRLKKLAEGSIEERYRTIAVAGADNNLGTTRLALIIAGHLCRTCGNTRYTEAHEDYVVQTLRRLDGEAPGTPIMRDYREYLSDSEGFRDSLYEVFDCGELTADMPACFYEAELVIIVIGSLPWESREAQIAERLSRDLGNRLFFCSQGEQPAYVLCGVEPENIKGFAGPFPGLKQRLGESEEELLDEIISKR